MRHELRTRGQGYRAGQAVTLGGASWPTVGMVHASFAHGYVAISGQTSLDYDGVTPTYYL